MQIPLEPAAGLLALVAALVMARGLLGNPAQSAADSRLPDTSPWTNALGHDHRRIVVAQEARTDTTMGLVMVGVAFVIQCASVAWPNLSPNGWAGWLIVAAVPSASGVLAYYLRPRLTAVALDKVALAQDPKVTYMSGNPAPSQAHRVDEMRILLHRAVNDERLRKVLQRRWRLAEIECRSYSHFA